MTSALLCLALAVYHEARNEPVEGQVAVAQVVLNRVDDPRYPDTICAVVEQGPRSGGNALYRCQFSYWCDGKPERPYNSRAWRQAKVVAKLAHEGVLDAGIEDATHYHASYARPFWSEVLIRIASIGRHTFYRS